MRLLRKPDRRRPQSRRRHRRFQPHQRGALAFYYDNEAAINEAIRQARELGEQLGARSAYSTLKTIKGSKKVP